MDTTGVFYIWQLKEGDATTSPSLTQVGAGKLVPSSVTTCSDCVATVTTNSNSIYAVEVHSTSTCGAAVQLWTLASTGYTPTTIGAEVCYSTAKVVSFSVDALYTTSQTAGGCAAGAILVVVAYGVSSGSVVSFTQACVNTTTGAVASGVGVGTPAAVTVGTAPSISLATLNSEPFLFMSHDNAFCWNSENKNKDAGKSICDLTPSSDSNRLGFSYGFLADWRAVAAAGGRFSVCSLSVFHGTYDRGSAPASSLFTTPAGNVGVVEVHHGDTTQDLSCGDADNHANLVMLDSFALWTPVLR
eukprot:TRINITY_DN1295_c0_g1_i5.p1 TRINITY_DN1295_c0_g1~~TRINITY_DN1295_c0_g1_i5.p1  ORF type:complete len:301 (+),score=88.55 TRINITY_DN1295_c0_g1_i5:244-1146(+)